MKKAIDKNQSTSVWDFPTRLFHWALAIGILLSWLSVELDYMEVHLISGAVVTGLLLFRIFWGLWGASTAQFHRFIPTPKRLLNYLKGQGSDYLGHSPLGALSVIAMLILLLVQALTGLVSEDDIYLIGPLNQFVSADVAEFAHRIHHSNWEILQFFIALHIGAIFYYLFFKKRNLIIAMITGRQVKNQISAAAQQESLQKQHPLVAVISLLIATGITYWLFTIL